MLYMGFFKTAPMRFLLLVTGAWLVIFLLTRSVLLLTHLDEVGGDVCSRCFGIGLLTTWPSLPMPHCPLGLYLLLCPPALWRRRGHRWFLQAAAHRQPVRDAVYLGGRMAVLG